MVGPTAAIVITIIAIINTVLLTSALEHKTMTLLKLEQLLFHKTCYITNLMCEAISYSQ